MFFNSVGLAGSAKLQTVEPAEARLMDKTKTAVIAGRYVIFMEGIFSKVPAQFAPQRAGFEKLIPRPSWIDGRF
jgi:hypothetical protein